MENELISKETEQRIINDLKNLIGKKKAGKIKLKAYIDSKMGACMDFAMLYESSDELQYFINTERKKGVNIEVNEDSIDIL